MTHRKPAIVKSTFFKSEHQIEITLQDVIFCSAVTEEKPEVITELMNKPYIRRQLERIDPAALEMDLSENDIEFPDTHESRLHTLLWISCDNIGEEYKHAASMYNL